MLAKKLPNRFRADTEYFRKLTWLDRLKIAFGFNLKVRIETAVDKRTQQVWQKVTVETTKAESQQGQLRDDNDPSSPTQPGCAATHGSEVPTPTQYIAA